MQAGEHRKKVVILTDTYRIKGYIELLPGSRVTDYIQGAKDFIVVTDAEVWSIEGNGLVLSAQFIDVSRGQIEVMTTTDTQKPLASVAVLEQAAVFS
jgi:acyl CoA:acetate/3-ketoacid CoA transferase beta subunit